MKTSYKDFLILEHTKQFKTIVKKWMKESDRFFTEYTELYFFELLEKRYINNNTYMIDAYFYLREGGFEPIEKLEKIAEIMKKKKQSYVDVIKYDSIDDYLEGTKGIKTSKDLIKPQSIEGLELMTERDEFSVYKIKDDDLYKHNTFDVIEEKRIEYILGQELKGIDPDDPDIDYEEEKEDIIDNIDDYNYASIESYYDDEDIIDTIGKEKFNKIEKCREDLVKLLKSHLGKNANPWCLLESDEENGEYELSLESNYYWYAKYTGTDKYVAFRKNKIIAFAANNYTKMTPNNLSWYNLQDDEQKYIYSGNIGEVYYNVEENKIEYKN